MKREKLASFRLNIFSLRTCFVTCLHVAGTLLAVVSVAGGRLLGNEWAAAARIRESCSSGAFDEEESPCLDAASLWLAWAHQKELGLWSLDPAGQPASIDAAAALCKAPHTVLIAPRRVVTAAGTKIGRATMTTRP